MSHVPPTNNSPRLDPAQYRPRVPNNGKAWYAWIHPPRISAQIAQFNFNAAELRQRLDGGLQARFRQFRAWKECPTGLTSGSADAEYAMLDKIAGSLKRNANLLQIRVFAPTAV